MRKGERDIEGELSNRDGGGRKGMEVKGGLD